MPEVVWPEGVLGAMEVCLVVGGAVILAGTSSSYTVLSRPGFSCLGFCNVQRHLRIL